MLPKVKKIFLVLPILVSFFAVYQVNLIKAAALNEASPQELPEYAADEIIVKFKSQVPPAEVDRFNRDNDTHFTRHRRFADFTTLRIPKGISAKEFIKKVKNDPKIEYAEPNYIAHALMVPNDPYYKYQWHFDNPEYGGIHAEQAWDISKGSGVIIAIADTGIAYENYRQNWWNQYEIAPDLVGTCFVKGFDFANNDSHPNDDNGHGTHVAGTAAQTTNNSTGTAGLAHSACLMPVKVLNSQGSGTYADIAEGIRYAADNGASVINLSLGGSADAQVLLEAAAYAYNKGATIVAAAGNNSSSQLTYPAAYDDYVVAVGATRYDETLSYYSNYGSSIDLVAPGGDLTVDQNNDGYKDGILQQTFDKNPKDWGWWFYQGTSMASPHVAAVAAMVIANGAAGPDYVRTRLENTADDLGSPGKDNTYGWGLVNAARALGSTSAPPSPIPTPSPNLSPSPSPSPTFLPSPSPSPSPSPAPTPENPVVTITNHAVSTRWSRWSKSRIDILLSFTIDSGLLSNIIIKEIADETGNWSLYRNTTSVDIYVNGVRNRTNFSWDASSKQATIDLKSLGMILTAGDHIEIKNFRLSNDAPGGHSLTNQIWNEDKLLSQNTVEFNL